MANAGKKGGNNSRLDGDSGLIDAGLSLLGVFAVIVLVIYTGGFNFFTPWFLWPTVVFFLLGLGRGVGTNESFWRRTVLLNVAWLFVIPLAFLTRPWWLGLLFVFLPTIPIAAGLYLRRLCVRRKWSRPGA